MLEANQLMKKYMSVTAVENITLTLETGKIYALLGPNGSGKSTFMKMAAGLIKPTNGSIQFEGNDIGIYSKSHIAYMPTEAYFYSYMTCKDIGKYYNDFFEDFDLDKFNRRLDQMELSQNQKASKMSSGMMAKLKIAVTLGRDAKLIMLDESLNCIYIIARDKVLNTIIDNFSTDKTFLISSHLVDELEKLVD